MAVMTGQMLHGWGGVSWGWEYGRRWLGLSFSAQEYPRRVEKVRTMVKEEGLGCILAQQPC